MASPNILSPNSQTERIADARFAKALGELADRIARVEAAYALLLEQLDQPDTTDDWPSYTVPMDDDNLERLSRQLAEDADPFGIGPAGTVPSLSEAFDFPPPPHIGIRRAARLLADVDRTVSLSYADHARACARLDGGAA